MEMSMTTATHFERPGRQSSPLLRAALLLDAVATGASGLLMAVGATPLERLLGIDGRLLLIAGLALLPYAALVGYFGLRRDLPPIAVWVVIAANIVWAVDCTLLAAGLWGAPTMLGKAFALVQAVAVVAFAAAQYGGLKRTTAPLAA
jgi:hypothetical protein